MVPAQQGFHPGDASVLSPDNWLILDTQLVSSDHPSQVVLKGRPVLGPLSLPQVDDLVVGATVALGLVHRRVGILEQLIGEVLAPPGEGDADARRYRHLDASKIERDREGVHDSLADDLGLRLVLEVLAQDDELVAGHTGQGVAGPEQ